ncbi:MAG: peptide ABC transporter substrate-binding protein [Paracoccaceae bacterium]
MTFRTTFAASMTAALLASTGLSTAALADAHATHPETGEALASDQTFTYRMLDEWKTIDPQLASETAGFHAIRDLFEGLYNSAPDGSIEPGVALSHEVNEDNTVYTFTLRDDARWSNGDPVTAGDFVYGMQRAVDPETASEYSWYMEITTIENAAEIIAGEAEPETLGVRAIDDTTLEITLTESLPYFPLMTTFATMFPAHRATIEEHGTDWTRPENIVSNGAYTLTEHVINERHTRTKSDTYWDADNTIIEETVGLVINDENQALTRYLAGELDHVEPLPAGRFPELEAEYPEQANSVPRTCSYYYSLNQSEDGPEALKDPNVRRALSLAIDRDVIVDQILQGGQRPAYTFTHWAIAGFEAPEVEMASMTQAERDAEAQRLIEESGFSGEDLAFDLIYNTSDSHRQIATVIGQMWKQKLGVEVSMSNYEWTTYLDVRSSGDFDVARAAWCSDYNEPSTFLSIMTTGNEYNDGSWSDEQFDALVTEARTSADPYPLYQQMEELLNATTGIVPIYHYANAFMIQEDIEGWPYGNAENNWYSRDLYRIASE